MFRVSVTVVGAMFGVLSDFFEIVAFLKYVGLGFWFLFAPSAFKVWVFVFTVSFYIKHSGPCFEYVWAACSIHSVHIACFF